MNSGTNFVEDGWCIAWICNGGLPRLSSNYATRDIAMDAATLIAEGDLNRTVLRVMPHSEFARMMTTPVLVVEDTGL